MATPSSFVQQYGPLAAQVGQQIGVSPDLVLGQWGLETGWGKSVIPGTNNLGNIKGAGVSAVDNATGLNDQYRAYQDPQSFGSDYASLLQNRYPKATNVGDNATAFADALKSGGYAQDPQYASKLTGAINTVRKLGETLANAISGTAQAAEVSPKLANDPTWQLLQSSSENQSVAQNQAPVPPKLANDPTWQLLNATQPKEQPQKQEAAQAASFPGAIESFAAGLSHGFGSTVLGAQQLLGHGLETLGANNVGNWLVNDANQRIQNINQEYAPYQTAHSVASEIGNLGGSIAAAAPLGAMAPVAEGLGGTAAIGAGLGAATGALTPVNPNAPDFASEKLKQMALGGVTGGVLSPVAGAIGRIVSPTISPDVTALMEKGVTPTPGQILGGGFATTESKLTSIPVLGDMIRNAQQRALGQFNEAAYNQALAPIGETFTGKIGNEGIQQVAKKIGDVYDDVLPQMSFKVDPQFQSDVVNLGGMAQNLPDAQQKTFMNILKTQIFNKLGPQGTMDGETLKGVQSELARRSANYLKDPSADARDLGAAIAELRNSVDSNLLRVNPPDLANKLSGANQAWANFVRLRSAASSQGAMNTGGVFTAAQLQNAVRGADKSLAKGATAKGTALMQDLSSAGQNVLGSKYPDSGTVGRGLMDLLATGSLGAGLATAPTSTMATLGGIGLGTLPYTQLGQKIAASLLTSRPQFAQPVGNLINRLGPRVVAGSLPALLSGNR